MPTPLEQKRQDLRMILTGPIGYTKNKFGVNELHDIYLKSTVIRELVDILLPKPDPNDILL